MIQPASCRLSATPLDPRAGRLRLALPLALSLVVALPGALTPSESPRGAASLRAVFADLPLTFEANEGQASAAVKFLARGPGYGLFLTSDEVVLVLRMPDHEATSSSPASVEVKHTAGREVLRMKLAGASGQPKIVGLEPLRARSHYFVGSDPAKWKTNVRNYARVAYREAYPGIDVVFYGNQRQLEYDLVLSPGADPDAISLQFDGARRIEVDANGALVLHTATGPVVQRAPVIYQDAGGRRRLVEGRYVLKGPATVGFSVTGYERTQALVIDPVIAYSTYFGGSSTERVDGVAVDGLGHAYLTGTTFSADLPLANPLQPAPGNTVDAYVAKLDPSQSGVASLIYSTYLGGSESDQALDIAADALGNAYVGGVTGSANFPTTIATAFQPTFAGGSCPSHRPCVDGFVTKLDATGSALLYSTYLGGTAGNPDHVNGIAVNSLGHVWVVGNTNSASFPTSAGAFQPAIAPGTCGEAPCPDPYVAKLDPSQAGAASLLYSTYLGGTFFEIGIGVAADGLGRAHVGGLVASTDFPVVNALRGTLNGPEDGWAAVVDPSLSGAASLVYSTYLGGSSGDIVTAVAADATGHTYAAGGGSNDFPTTPGAFQTTPGGGDNCGLASNPRPCRDSAVVKLDSSQSGATSLVFSTLLGGSGADGITAIVVDASGNAHVAGSTTSTNFPLVNPVQASLIVATCGFPPQTFACPDAFAAKLNASGSALLFSTYLGGNSADSAAGVGIDGAGDVYVGGETASTDFPTVNAFQSTNASPSELGSPGEAFLTKIDMAGVTAIADLAVTKADSPDPVVVGTSLTYTITVTNAGPDAATGVALTDVLPASMTFGSATPSQGSCTGTGPVVCTLGSIARNASANVAIVVTPTVVGTFTNTVTVSATSLDSTPANNTATAETTVMAEPPPPPPTLYPGPGQRPADVNAFLQYASPLDARTELPAGTTSYEVHVFYGATIDPATFQATLNDAPFGGFTPVPGGNEVVAIPLSPGRNVLVLEVQGTRLDGRSATDRDRLTFVVR